MQSLQHSHCRLKHVGTTHSTAFGQRTRGAVSQGNGTAAVAAWCSRSSGTSSEKTCQYQKCCCVTANCLTNLDLICLQVDGATLLDLKMEDLAEIAPGATRAETKLLRRIIRDIQVATEVSLQQLSTENEGLLRQLNKWFPGKFRTAIGTPLYVHDETTVVRAAHKVISMLDVVVMLWCVITCHCMRRLPEMLSSKSS